MGTIRIYVTTQHKPCISGWAADCSEGAGQGGAGTRGHSRGLIVTVKFAFQNSKMLSLPSLPALFLPSHVRTDVRSALFTSLSRTALCRRLQVLGSPSKVDEHPSRSHTRLLDPGLQVDTQVVATSWLLGIMPQ